MAYVTQAITHILPRAVSRTIGHAVLAVVAFCALPALAHDARMPMAMGGAASAKVRPQLAATSAFDAQGRLWVVWAEGRHVLVRHSDDQGRTLSTPVTINPVPEPIYTDGENRPKIIVSPDGALYVTYSMPLARPYTGMVRFSRSLDGGRTWSAPVTVNHDAQPITHRFDSIAVDPQGRIFIAWIDKRDLALAKKAGQPYDGAAVYYTVSTDRGATFAPDRKVTDHTCECCRIALTVDPEGHVLAMWRNVFPGQIRDHALAVLPVTNTPLSVQRATFSNWHVEACPEHGPSLVVAPDGVRHMAWFASVDGKPDIYYSRLSGDGKPRSAPWAFGTGQSSHPYLLLQGKTLWLAWKYFDGNAMRIMTRHSDDDGRHWSKAAPAAQTAGASDHPQLLAHHGHVFLSWRTQNEGFRLIALAAKE